MRFQKLALLWMLQENGKYNQSRKEKDENTKNKKTNKGKKKEMKSPQRSRS